MIDALVNGRLYAAPKSGTAKNGNPYATAKLLVPLADERAFCNVIAFDRKAVDALLVLAEGDSVSIAGELRPKIYNGNDGPRVSLDMTAHAVLTVYHVRRKRQAIEDTQGEQA